MIPEPHESLANARKNERNDPSSARPIITTSSTIVRMRSHMTTGRFVGAAGASAYAGTAAAVAAVAAVPRVPQVPRPGPIPARRARTG